MNVRSTGAGGVVALLADRRLEPAVCGFDVLELGGGVRGTLGLLARLDAGRSSLGGT
jgi:hypothetical protein